MPSTARTSPAPVRNSVCKSLTSRSGAKTPPAFPFPWEFVVLIESLASCWQARITTLVSGVEIPVNAGKLGFIHGASAPRGYHRRLDVGPVRGRLPAPDRLAGRRVRALAGGAGRARRRHHHPSGAAGGAGGERRRDRKTRHR